MTNLDLSAAIAAAANELQGGTKSEPQGQPAKKSAPKKSATTKSATAKPTAKTDTPKEKGGAKAASERGQNGTRSGSAEREQARPKVKYVIPKEFKQAIEDYLTGRPDMSEKLKQTGKSINKCCEYIYARMLKRAQKERGGATTVGMYVDPNEIYGMAVHYYDESDEDLKKEV